MSESRPLRPPLKTITEIKDMGAFLRGLCEALPPGGILELEGYLEKDVAAYREWAVGKEVLVPQRPFFFFRSRPWRISWLTLDAPTSNWLAEEWSAEPGRIEPSAHLHARGPTEYWMTWYDCICPPWEGPWFSSAIDTAKLLELARRCGGILS
ncbi:MAG TPA: hypothetical protein VM509_13485, partial [Planctomycetota bacterium]|nr:hypothetical protein [Planctomycetota bacterium]